MRTDSQKGAERAGSVSWHCHSDMGDEWKGHGRGGVHVPRWLSNEVHRVVVEESVLVVGVGWWLVGRKLRGLADQWCAEKLSTPTAHIALSLRTRSPGREGNDTSKLC